jgi:vancomycin resistance protein YoaR
MYATSSLNSQKLDRVVQILAALMGGFFLFFFSLILIIILFQIWFAGRIYPGVSVAGVDLGGLRQSDAIQKLLQEANYPLNGHILLRDREATWLVTPMDVGLFLDSETTTQTAYAIGRTGGSQRLVQQFNALYYGIDLPLSLVFDQRIAFKTLENLRPHTDAAVIEANLQLNGTEVIVTSGQNGRALNINDSMTAIEAQITALQDGVVDLTIDELPAIIVDVTAQAELARQILSQPLVLSMPEDQPDTHGPWRYNPEELAGMLNLERVSSEGKEEYQVTIETQAIRTFLTELEPSLAISSENARFIFNDDTRLLEVIQPAVIGRSLNIETSITSIQKQLVDGSHEIDIDFNLSPPEITDDVLGQDIGITGLLHAETSYFFGSDSARVQNISAAASQFHGILIAPGETYSMASELGDISLENGYAEAWIIYGDQTIKGVGGGVCQVSTTLFRTAFFAGFPIAERYPHAYRVSYYEKVAGNRIDPRLAGLDATVYVPVVDFKFTNDSEYWLLMETYVNPTYSSITWKFYSTNDGRTVEWETSGPVDIVPELEAVYRENAEFEKDEIKQVDWGVDGANVNVNRTVFKDGANHLQDTFYTKYQPWGDVFEYGPGTEGMPPKENTSETGG